MRILPLFVAVIKLAPNLIGGSRKSSVNHTFRWIPAKAGMTEEARKSRVSGGDDRVWFVRVAIVVRMTVVVWMMNIGIRP